MSPNVIFLILTAYRFEDDWPKYYLHPQMTIGSQLSEYTRSRPAISRSKLVRSSFILCFALTADVCVKTTARMTAQADAATGRSAMISDPHCLQDNRLQLFYTALMDSEFTRTIIVIRGRKLPANGDLQTQIFFSIEALQRLIITSLLLSQWPYNYLRAAARQSWR
jgi:hypothetical protein